MAEFNEKKRAAKDEPQKEEPQEHEEEEEDDQEEDQTLNSIVGSVSVCCN